MAGPLDITALRYIRFDNPSEAVIPAKSGESHKIINIFVDDPADKSYVDIIIGTTNVARIPIKWGDSLFIAPVIGNVRDYSIVDLIHDIFGKEYDFEADEDEDITFKFSAAPGALHVVYEVGKPGIDKTKPLRSMSEVYPLFAMVTHSASVSANGNVALDVALAPTGFPDIKDGFVIPSGRKLQLKVIAHGTVVAGGTGPTFLHLWDEKFELITPISHKGISVQSGMNLVAFDITKLDWFHILPYELLPGHKITLNEDMVYDGTNTLAAQSELLVLIGNWVKAR